MLEFGPLVRLGGVLTDYPLDEYLAEKEMENKCGSCTICLDSCPAGALERFSINKKKCGDHVFTYGLRGFASFLEEVAAADESKRHEVLRSPALREIWQNFMTGCYCTVGFARHPVRLVKDSFRVAFVPRPLPSCIRLLQR